MDDTFLGREAGKKLEDYYLKSLKNTDSILIVDYGHGLISDEFLEFLKSKKVSDISYVANAQANAGNLGLNSILRYEWCDSIVLNGSEVQLEMRQSKLGARKLLKNFSKRVITPNILITLGKNGLVYKSENGALIEKGAFSAEGIVDRTGAGDALLACYTVFQTLDIPSSELLNFCNLGGYFSSRFVGNADSLTLSALYQITHSR
jgi:sugar/nucleoside kinase (ribokinase family)